MEGCGVVSGGGHFVAAGGGGGVDVFSGCRRCEMIPIAAGVIAIRFDY